jgi:hypothetical protein
VLHPRYETWFDLVDAGFDDTRTDRTRVTITGEFRVEFEAEYDQRVNSGLQIRVLDAAGNQQVVGQGPPNRRFTQGGGGSFDIEGVPPGGTYTVEAIAQGNNYDVAIYDCPLVGVVSDPDPSAPAVGEIIAVIEGEGAQVVPLDLTGVDEVRIAYAAGESAPGIGGEIRSAYLGLYGARGVSSNHPDGFPLVQAGFRVGDDHRRDEPLGITSRPAFGTDGDPVDTTDELPAERRPGSRIEVSAPAGVRYRVEVSVIRQTGPLRPYDPAIFGTSVPLSEPEGKDCRVVDSLGTIGASPDILAPGILGRDVTIATPYRSITGPQPQTYLVADEEGRIVYEGLIGPLEGGQFDFTPGAEDPGFAPGERYRIGITTAVGDGILGSVYLCSPVAPEPPRSPPAFPYPTPEPGQTPIPIPTPAPPLPSALRACVADPQAKRVLGPGSVSEILRGTRNADVIRVQARRGGAALTGRLGAGDDIVYVTGNKPVAKAIDTGSGNDIVFYSGRRTAQAIRTGPGNDLVCVQDTSSRVETASGNDSILARNHVGAEDVGSGRDSIVILRGSRKSALIADVRDGQGGDLVDVRRAKAASCQADKGDRTLGCSGADKRSRR